MSEAGLAIFTPGRKKKKKRSGLWPSVRKWAHCSVRQGQGCDGADQGTSGVSSRRKSTTKGRALLWYYCLLFAAHDAEWHKEDASALVLQVFSCMWKLARDLSVVLAQRHPCHQSAVSPVLTGEQTVWYWHTQISHWGISYKGLWGGYPVVNFFFFFTAPLAPSSHFHTPSSSL